MALRAAADAERSFAFEVPKMNQDVIDFFAVSDFIEHEVLRPLSHIRGNWELIFDHETGRYMDEEDSFAWLFNHLIDELAAANPPARYHDSEDRLGEYVQRSLNWNIRKENGIWVNVEGNRLHPSNYLDMLEKGGFKTGGDRDLVDAASGRIRAAIKNGQKHFDDMERSHQVILAGVLAVILFHRDSHEDYYRGQVGEQIAPSDCPAGGD